MRTMPNGRNRAGALVTTVFIAATVLHAQTPRLVPRPPAQPPGAPQDGSAAPDGYAPIPEWLGQTRAPHPAASARYEIETVATGIMNGFAFHFLPDGRMLLTERPGRLRIVEKTGRISDPVEGLPPVVTGGPQGLFAAVPDRDF